MSWSDPIADMLTRVRNASAAHHDEVAMPHSKIKEGIAAILQSEGYVAGVRTEEAPVGKTLIVDLKYGPNRERSIEGIKRVSKPGRRVYMGVSELPSVRNGLGVAIVSTPKGVLSDANARAANVGGEVLCTVF